MIIDGSKSKLNTPPAANSLETAIKIKAWCCNSTNAGILTHLNNYLVTFFKVWTSAPVTTKYVREQVWTRFSSFLSSEEYIQFWTTLYTVVGVQEIPLLSFELTYVSFTNYWKQVTSSQMKSTEKQQMLQPLTIDERSALWYCSGYLIRKLRNNIKKSLTTTTHNNKIQKPVLCLLDTFLETDETEIDEEEKNNENEDISGKKWLNTISRGGLLRCTNDFHTLLCTIEIQVRLTCQYGMVKRDEEIERVRNNEEVSTIWEKISAGCEVDCEEKAKSFLLQEILKNYITIRGFRYSDLYLEKHKILCKRSIQKEKSLRSKLNHVNEDD